MLTFRSLSLTFLGLLTGFMAAAQTTDAGPTPTILLSWVVWAVAGVVLLMAIIIGASVTSAAQRRDEAAQAKPTAAEAVVAEVAPVQTTVVEVIAEEEVYA